MKVSYEIIATDETAASQLTIYSPAEEFDIVETVFGGWAKRHPNDNPSADIGAIYATARAFQAAADWLFEIAAARTEPPVEWRPEKIEWLWK